MLEHFRTKNNGSDSFSTVLTFLNSFLDGTESCCVLFSVEDGMGPYFHFPDNSLLLFSFEIVCPLLWCCTPAGLALSSRPPLKVVGREAHAGTMKTFTIVVWVPHSSVDGMKKLGLVIFSGSLFIRMRD